MTRHKYVPTEVDLRWARNVVAVVKDGGTLAYPATLVIYKVDHTNKRLVIQNPEILQASFASFVIHQQSIDVFEAIGYTVGE